MTTKREQLEICARFMGYEVVGWCGDCPQVRRSDCPYAFTFNPLHDDTDSAALRRSGRIDLEYEGNQIRASACIEGGEFLERVSAREKFIDHANDIGAAERAAVVGCVVKMMGGGGK